jgi:hypothetical protein
MKRFAVASGNSGWRCSIENVGARLYEFDASPVPEPATMVSPEREWRESS